MVLLTSCRGVGARALSNGINSAVFFCFFEALRATFAQKKQEVQSFHPHAMTHIAYCMQIKAILLLSDFLQGHVQDVSHQYVLQTILLAFSVPLQPYALIQHYMS